MGSRYLTELPSLLRAAGLKVHEEPGWETRSRRSGGYEKLLGISNHHTASHPTSDGQRDVNFICYGSINKPISNLYLARTGEVWVCAAGATNTVGLGGPWLDIPQNGGNATTIGLEMANDGRGEAWPNIQVDACLAINLAIWKFYGVEFGWDDLKRSFAHFEWAPGRKIDPRGPSKYNGFVNTYWDMNAFRRDLHSKLNNPPVAPVPPVQKKGDKMLIGVRCEGDNASFISDGINKWWVPTPGAFDHILTTATISGNPIIDFLGNPITPGQAAPIVNKDGFKGYGIVIGPLPPGGPRDMYGVLV